ncbi:MAG TPA: DMT family transporter [Candidatus Saccharimonadales bacterium]|nr:DMT family transporter [Candidatus Saccharimonadales bacterium]
MLAALLTTLLFAISAICGYRTARQIGGVEANFWRACLATIFLAVWANTLGNGFEGAAFPVFVLSGLAGIGLGDSGYFQALPRLGSRRTVLLTQCLTAPFAVVIEWLWLGTTLNMAVLFCIMVILVGVAVALAPKEHLEITPRERLIGICGTVVAALGGALGAVLSRKAYAVAHAADEHPDPGTTGYQRVIGGAIALGILLLIVKWRSARIHGGVLEMKSLHVSRDKWRRLWPWVVANSLAGQTVGVSCMQWALENTSAGIVTAVIATTPILLLPMTRLIDDERIGARSTIGALIAVAGVIGLTFSR